MLLSDSGSWSFSFFSSTSLLVDEDEDEDGMQQPRACVSVVVDIVAPELKGRAVDVLDVLAGGVKDAWFSCCRDALES